MSAAAPGTTIVIAPGTYVLTSTVWIVDKPDLTIRGATNNRDDVVLVGRGMGDSSLLFGLWTNSARVTIANLTIRDLYDHPIILNAGTISPHIYNVHLINAGQQFIKANPDTSGGGVDNGVVEYSVFEYTSTSRDDYTNGIDVHTGNNWIIRNNLFRNLVAPQGLLAGPVILIWNGSSNALVEGNTFINCQREISMGLIQRSPNDNSGGIVRNNFIYRRPGLFSDAGILVASSPNTQVLHNTIILNGTYPNAIEYRFPETTNAIIANNLASGQIQGRDGASGTVGSNYLTATPSMFVNAAVGDLHLLASATAAIDKVPALPNASTDWDGQKRPLGAAADFGADEFGTSSGTPTNTAPVVNAGGDQTIISPATATLTGAATDDRNPNPPGSLTTSWSLISGPGSVALSSPGALTTTATFSVAGVYTIRLTANDGALTSSDDVVVTVNAPQALGTGLLGQYFNDAGNGSYFTTLALTRTDATVNFDWVNAAPDPLVHADNFSVRWTGQLLAPATGTYTLTTSADDGVRLWINNQLVIDNWIDQGVTSTNATIALVAGTRYDVRLEYYDHTQLATARLLWTYPGQAQQVIPQTALYPPSAITPPPGGGGTGLLAQYFNDPGTGSHFVTPTLTRTDATVNFDWASGSPAAAVTADNFSARWTGQIKALVTGNHVFTTNADDGVRLWINGQLVIDNWVDQSATARSSAAIPLVAGSLYDIKLEYYEHGGTATVGLLWAYPGQPQTTIPQSQLYPATPPTNMAPLVSAGGNQVVALPSAAALAGSVTDDGLPLGAAVTTSWSQVSGPGSVTFATASAVATTASFPTTGTYILRLTASDTAATSSADVTITVNPAAPESSNGLLGEYFNDAGNGMYFTTLALSRTDATVNFDWTNAAPDPLVQADNFSVRWTGQLLAPVTGTYTLTTSADDGVRLWINNQLVIDNWVDQGVTSKNVPIAFVAGMRYDLRLEYYDHTKLATARLLWSYPGQTQQVIPQTALYPPLPVTPPPVGGGTGLLAQYFNDAGNGTYFTSLALTRTDATVNFDWAFAAPDPAVQTDNFSARWTGQVLAPVTGTYTLITSADDGVRLWINNQLLIDNWVDQGATSTNATIAFIAGTRYDLRLEYYDHTQWATARLLWSYPGQTQQVIPQNALYPAAIPSAELPVPAGATGAWTLTFRDEFDGNSLDRAVWATTYGGGGRTNNDELEWYTDDDSTHIVSNGTLKLTAYQQSSQPGFPYNSGMISSHNSFVQTYGFFEARMKLPAGQGFWPAFWLLPVHAWPPEIDTMENLGNDCTRVYLSNHWSVNWPDGVSGGQAGSVTNSYIGPNFCSGFHTYGVEWTPTTINFYVDGVLRSQLTDHVPVANSSWTGMALIANLAVGGSWPGAPDSSTSFPSALEIDYIRAWQR